MMSDRMIDALVVASMLLMFVLLNTLVLNTATTLDWIISAIACGIGYMASAYIRDQS